MELDLDLQQALVRAPIEVKGEHVRGTLETAPDKRPWNEAQAIFLRTMRENAGLTKEQFDMRWVSTGIRVSVNGAPPGCLAVPFPVASITIGANWVLNRENLQSFASRAKCRRAADPCGRRVTPEGMRQPRISLDRGSFARSI